MLDELIGVWQHESDSNGVRSHTVITIKADGSFVTRMNYQMPEGCQMIEHRGTMAASKTHLDITLIEGFTQDEPAANAGLAMTPFTEAELHETLRMLDAKIPYRITEHGELITEPTGPMGKMTVAYTRQKDVDDRPTEQDSPS